MSIRSLRPLRITTAGVSAAAAVLMLASAAEAAPAVTVPSAFGAAASARIDSFTSGTISRYSGTVSISSLAGACVYLSAKPTASLALDGDWKRKTANRCSGGYATFRFSDSFVLAYNGVKVRLCKDVFGIDPCGREVALPTR